MIDASIDTSRLAPARIVVLEILGADDLMWTTLRWSQNYFSMVQGFSWLIERDPNSVCIENVLLASYRRRNLLRVYLAYTCVKPLRKFLVEIHTAKMILCGVVFTPPRRLQQTAVSCKQSNCWNRTSEVLTKKRQTMDFPVLSCRFACILICGLELHHESLHCQQMVENSMIDASIDTSRMAPARVVVLEILGAEDLMWTTLRWSQNDFSMVQGFQTYWERCQFCLYRKCSACVIWKEKSF